MSRSRPANLAASIRQRLLNLSVSRAEDPNLTLTRFALERLLYRLARSEYAGQFILKGAMLFAVWMESAHRPTRDLDLLGFGEASNERLTEIFQRLCHMEVELDGLTFDARSVRVAEIREGQAYQGQRVKLIGLLGTARIPVQIDVGFGDVVALANCAISGESLAVCGVPAGVTISNLSDALSKLNENFVDCNTDLGCLALPDES